jgi:cytochrome oxidase Cu insertion factor (SCO1/SenC/PrrC family)
MQSGRLMFASVLIGCLLVSPVFAQPGKEEPEFIKRSPTIGEPFPSMTVYTPDGKEFKTSSFRGHYTVLSFGCLT